MTSKQAPLRLRWYGTAAIELEFMNQVLLLDPFLTRPARWRTLFRGVETDDRLVREHIRQGEHVLVSHAHYDHLMDVPQVLQATGARAFGSENTRDLLLLQAVPESQVSTIVEGDQLDLGMFQVQVLPAEHRRLLGFTMLQGPLRINLQPPLGLRDYRTEKTFSFLIGVGEVRVLVCSGVRAEQSMPAEVLVVAPYATVAFYEELLERVQPRLLIPFHWDDFTRPLSEPLRPLPIAPAWARRPFQRVNLADFEQLIKAFSPETSVLVPEPLRNYNLMSHL